MRPFGRSDGGSAWEISVLVGLDLDTNGLSSSLGFLHGLSHTGAGSAVALVVLCSINKSGGQIVNHLLYHSLNGHEPSVRKVGSYGLPRKSMNGSGGNLFARCED